MPDPPKPWPAHWYDDHRYIRCIVPHCEFVTKVHNLSGQWTQLYDHCTDTGGAEHDLLKIILRQSKCALCDKSPTFSGPKHWVPRAMYDHEQHAHGSATMFSIDSFVVLARGGHISFGNGGHAALQRTYQSLAFDRMMDKVLALPAAELSLLFRRSGYGAEEQLLSNLRRILSYDPLAQGRHDDPCWLPLKPDRFLDFCRPRGDEPADSDWRRVWRSLREEYADGRI